MTDPTLLVVDDNENNRVALTMRLQLLGYRNVACVENGRLALDMIAERDFDLVLLDIMMPDMNGYQVLERLRAEGRLVTLPVIVISALDELESVVRCIELGAEDYLTKPFNATLLGARIASVLEKRALRQAVVRQLGRYVPGDVAASIARGQGTLEPVRTTATILYSDIEGFTSIAENMPPERVFRMLNEYFSAVTGPILCHRGVVNQFLGDAMLLTFNVPLKDPHHADGAVKAAVEIHTLTGGKTFAGVRLRTRVGINTGLVIAGNVGSGERVTYTVYGDAVNLAARLEELNKEYDSLVMVSGSTVDLLSEAYPLESVGEVRIRGKRDPVRVFKLAV